MNKEENKNKNSEKFQGTNHTSEISTEAIEDNDQENPKSEKKVMMYIRGSDAFLLS